MANQKKIALVTGAGSGIGRAAALGLEAANFTVVLAGRRLKELEATAAKAAAGGGGMLPVATDVSDPASVKSLFERIAKEYGRLDVLFNNAGINVPAIPMDELSFEQWSSVVGVN
ncbi:MAG TPA: SDR family NAD(P)-dependent oxidoreductase, partial [Bryobacteraceae bacterium]|nr:SDR family NAD(P)-dependent oxidoreductase [Bryobacteraceae bacterium]